MAATTAGAPHSSVTPCRSIARQDLLAVHLAQHDVRAAHAGHGVGHPPAVAVEHRQRVQEDVAVADAGVPPERGGVQPAVALRQLHALRPRRRARRVVDRARRVLVGRPRPRLRALRRRREQRGVVGAVEPEPMGHLDGVHLVGQVRVVQEDRRPGVLDDVGDLVARQAEVDRHEDAPVAAHPEEGGRGTARSWGSRWPPAPRARRRGRRGPGPCPFARAASSA